MTKSLTETTDVCLWKGVSPLVSFLTSYHLLNPNITVYSDYILLHLYPLFFLSHHIVPSLRLFTPLNNHLSGHMYSAPILAAGCAPLNPTVMLWPGTDAVDLYTVCCERAPSICKSNLVLLGPLSFAISSRLLLLLSLHFTLWTLNCGSTPRIGFLAVFWADAE